jgi:hypothetical protein
MLGFSVVFWRSMEYGYIAAGAIGDMYLTLRSMYIR